MFLLWMRRDRSQNSPYENEFEINLKSSRAREWRCRSPGTLCYGRWIAVSESRSLSTNRIVMIAVQTRWGSLERVHQGSYRCSTNLSKPSPLAVRFSFEPGFGGFGPNISNITMDKRVSMTFQGTHPPPLWAHPRRQQNGPSKDPTSQSTQ